MSYTNPVTCPAYYLEQMAFNPSSQPKNTIHKELFSRVATVVAPIFYLYQIFLHGVVSLVDLALSLVFLSPGTLFQNAYNSCIYSAKCLFSSLFEIPQKMLFGPKNAPNYFGDDNRYHMINFRWRTI